MLDKRLFGRFEVKFDCYLALDKDFKVYQAHLLDLSLGGFRVITEAPLSAGKIVHFSFNSNPPIKGTARVVWVKKSAHSNQCEAGLEIIELKDRFRKALQDLINELTFSLSEAYFR
ncbi:MAG: PilZ domain-containing protein [Thermodesulfobacteria bacterium]|nr:PilZ domain-containing protein [Thermodesulfobacteriota bacterium]